jgi:hypothetical protein
MSSAKAIALRVKSPSNWSLTPERAASAQLTDIRMCCRLMVLDSYDPRTTVSTDATVVVFCSAGMFDGPGLPE